MGLQAHRALPPPHLDADHVVLQQRLRLPLIRLLARQQRLQQRRPGTSSGASAAGGLGCRRSGRPLGAVLRCGDQAARLRLLLVCRQVRSRRWQLI
jgi:hypothetical protein